MIVNNIKKMLFLFSTSIARWTTWAVWCSSPSSSLTFLTGAIWLSSDSFQTDAAGLVRLQDSGSQAKWNSALKMQPWVSIRYESYQLWSNFLLGNELEKKQVWHIPSILSRAVVPNLFWVGEHLRLEKTLAEHFGQIRTSCGTLKSLETKKNVAEQ